MNFQGNKFSYGNKKLNYIAYSGKVVISYAEA